MLINFIIMALHPFVEPWPLFEFPYPSHSREDSLMGLSQGHYLHTEQHRVNAHNTDIHAFNGI
jgi:hypothetical protein